MSIQLKDVSKTFVTAGIKVQAINDINLVINEGDFTMIVGPARSGKSTLLQMMSGKLETTHGEIQVLNQLITNMTAEELKIFQDLNMGFIYKHYKVLESTNIKENVLMKRKLTDSFADIHEVLEITKLNHVADKYPFQLANGEQQKVIIAREVLKKPKYLFCDDPTGAFSKATTILVLDVLKKITKTYGITCIMTTQNETLSIIADRTIYLNDGNVIKDEINQHIEEAKDIKWS